MWSKALIYNLLSEISQDWLNYFPGGGDEGEEEGQGDRGDQDHIEIQAPEV